MQKLVVEIRAYFAYCKDVRTEFVIVYAIAAIILIFGERLIIASIGIISPTAGANLNALDQSMRVLYFGLPLAVAFLSSAFWLNWRSIKRDRNESAYLNNRLLSVTMLEESITQPVATAINELRSRIPPISAEYMGERMLLLSEAESRFDPNSWFSVFSNVRPKSGYCLDFVYYFWGNGGYPLLYLRHEKEPRLKSREEYWQRYGGSQSSSVPLGNKPLLEHLEYDNTPQGFFEFTLFCLHAPRFYLHWHNQVGEFEIVVSRTQLSQILDTIPESAASKLPETGITNDQRELLSATDPRPIVSVDKHKRSATIKLLKWVSGDSFVWVGYQVEFPYPPREIDSEKILSYGVPKIY